MSSPTWGDMSTGTGQGGLAPAPLNAPSSPGVQVGIQPGASTGIFIGHLVIVGGSGSAVSGIFVYSGTPAHGNPPILSITNSTTDPFGNTVTPSLTLSGLPFLIYSAAPALGDLFLTAAGTSGSDEFGNNYQTGYQVHGTGSANIEMTTLGGVPIIFFSTGVAEETTGANIQAVLESPGPSEFIDLFISGAQISTAAGYVFIAMSGPAKDASLSPFGQLFWNDGTTNHGLLSWGITGIQVQDLIAGDAINYQTERLTLLNTGQTITSTGATAITGLTTASAGNVGTGTYRIKAWISYQGSVAAGAPTFVLNGPATSFTAAANQFLTNGAPAAINTGGVTLGGAQVGPTFQTSPQQLLIEGIFTFSAAGTVSMTGQTSAGADHLIINGGYLEIYPTGT